MNIQTKSTLIICGMFIVEILPVPFSSIYSLYAIRKRPDWLPDFTDALYANKPVVDDQTIAGILASGHDPMATRRKYTLILVAMFMVDLLVPVVIPMALYIVRVRPKWFRIIMLKLYSDKVPLTIAPAAVEIPDDPEILAAVAEKMAELERQNSRFAQSLSTKAITRN